MTRKYKKWFADMFRNRLFRYVQVGKQIKVQYNGQIMTKEDLNYLYDIHEKNKAK